MSLFSCARLAAAGLAAMLLLAPADAPAQGEPDASRIVSLGGSVTEILHALGAGDRIVAVDTTSRFPASAGALPQVGYLRSLSAEGVLSVQPSMILAEADAGPAETVALLEQASLAFLKAPDTRDAAGIADKIAFVADAVGLDAEGEALAGTVTADLAAVTGATGAIERRARVFFVLSAAGGRIVAAGEETSAAAMIAMAGATNALSGFSGYKPVGDEAVLAAAPEVVVMMGGAGPQSQAPADILALPALAATPAGRDGRMVVMDGLYLLGFGPRTAHAVADLARAIYPDADLPPLPARPWTGDVK